MQIAFCSQMIWLADGSFGGVQMRMRTIIRMPCRNVRLLCQSDKIRLPFRVSPSCCA